MSALGLGLGLINYAANAGALNQSDPRFIITVKTDNAGTSASDQFTLPWSGTYDVEWGDGTSSLGVSGSQTHTYASAGTYNIAVTAVSGTITFSNVGDKAKLIELKNWGDVIFTIFGFNFKGCSNLIAVSAKDAPDLSVCRYLAESFYGCTSLLSIDVSKWDTSYIQQMYLTFYNCLLLKTDISGFDIESVVSFASFAQNTQINEVSGGTQITTNYDNTLISWAAQNPLTGKSIHFGSAKYSSAAAAARALLTDSVESGGYGWTIADGGPL